MLQETFEKRNSNVEYKNIEAAAEFIPTKPKVVEFLGKAIMKERDYLKKIAKAIMKERDYLKKVSVILRGTNHKGTDLGSELTRGCLHIVR